MSKIVIYGREGCPYCVKAKELAEQFKVNGNQVKEVEYLDQYVVNWTKEDVAKHFSIKVEDINTVPQIGIETTGSDGSTVVSYIGGYNHLVVSDLY